jgi:hypothetical protein
MAAASVKALLAHPHPSTSAIMAATGANQQGRESKGRRSSPAEEVLERSEEDLGRSSKTLGVDDFELVRTLGTGMSARPESMVLSGLCLINGMENITWNWMKGLC